MYGSPFCYHTFSAEQLADNEVVKCACGHSFKSADLSEFARIKKVIEQSNAELGSLVQQMAAFNTGNKPAAAAPEPEVVRPQKPKREKVSLSVTQWLIVGAGFLVLISASIFVSQNLNSWNVYGWSALELALGLVTGFGAFKLKKFSVLLTNFLAVFSSAMLLTLIMSFATTFGWGFNAWDHEPAWFWSTNLATVALVSLGLGMVSKNFGWRAVAPLSLTASAIVLVVNSSGNFEDRWRVAVLSVALFAILITVRLARNARWEVPTGNDAEYMADLQHREDNSLKRFGLAVAILLAAYAAISTAQLLVLHTFTTTIDASAALVTAVVWLVGARINKSWVNAIVDKDATILTLRNSASAVGLSYLGLGTLAAVHGFGTSVGLSVAVGLLVLVFALEQYAKFLLLPRYAVTIAAWVTAGFGYFWFLQDYTNDFDLITGAYLAGLTLAFASREFYAFSSLRSIVLYVTGLAATLSVYYHLVRYEPWETPRFAVYFASALIVANLVPLLVSWLRTRASAKALPIASFLPLIQSTLISLVSLPIFIFAKSNTYLLSIAAGLLLITLVGRLRLKKGDLLTAVSHHSFVAIGLSIALTLAGRNIDSLKVGSAFILVEGLAVFGYSLLAKNIRWANLGFAVTNVSVLIADIAWGTDKSNVVVYAVSAMLVGAAANLGLIWATKRFSKESVVTNLVTRITTAVSLAFLLVGALRFDLLDEKSIWLLTGTPLLIALVIELRKANNFSFIYAGGALVASNMPSDAPASAGYFARVTLVFAFLAFAFIRRANAQKRQAWAYAGLLASGLAGGFAAQTAISQFKINWQGPEIYSLSIALAIAVAAYLTKTVSGKAHTYLQLDLPVLIAAAPSLIYALGNYGKPVESANRFLLAAAVIWAHNVWRGFERRQLGWLVAQSITGVLFGFSVARALYENFQLTWEGPELYSVAILGTALVSIRFADKLGLLQGSLIRNGLPVAIALTPSTVFTWNSITLQFSELNASQITRTIAVLALSVAVMVFGILRGNRGLNLVGTAELWLIGIPALWFKTSAVDNGSSDLELRGLMVAALVYWIISLVREFRDVKLKSVVWIGIPLSIALAPAIFHALSSLGGLELRTVDWWRFSIVLSASLVLLVVGALREIGGTFYPGLIGVLVTILPYGFVPVANKEWYLWAILLGVAGLLVWLAVRLENMRKAGREPSAWLKELK